MASTRASRSKRARRSGSAVKASGRNFDCHFAPKGFVVGAVDLAHPADAKQRADRVGPEAVANELVSRGLEPGRVHQRCGRHPHERIGVRLAGKQRFDLTLQIGIAGTRRGQERGPLSRGTCQRHMAEIFDLPPAVSGQGSCRLVARAATTALPSSNRALRYPAKCLTPRPSRRESVHRRTAFQPPGSFANQPPPAR